MTKKERQNLLQIIDITGQCNKDILYFCQMANKNAEQSEAAINYALFHHSQLAQAFLMFAPSINRALFERALETADNNHKKEIENIFGAFEKQVENIDNNVNNNHQQQPPFPKDFGTELGINLNVRQEIIDYLNSQESDEEEGNLLNYGDFVENSEKDDEEIEKEVRRRVFGENKPIGKKPETFQEIEKENIIKESSEMVKKINLAIQFHKIRRNKQGKYY